MVPGKPGKPGPPLLITAPRVVPAGPVPAVLEPGYVAIEAGLITAVGQGPPPDVPGLVLADGVLVPGLIDLQVNGRYGEDLAGVDPAGWARVVRRLPETGTTAFLPTFITAPVGELAGALRSAAGFVPDLPGGARVLGVHLEGPFLAAARAGAHRRDWIVPATVDAVADLLAAGAGVLRVVTLAPEVAGGLAAWGWRVDALSAGDGLFGAVPPAGPAAAGPGVAADESVALATGVAGAVAAWAGPGAAVTVAGGVVPPGR